MTPTLKKDFAVPAAPFWSYRPLRPMMRRLLLVVVGSVLVVDSLLRATSAAETSLLRAVVGTSIIVLVALFAWRPPVAAIALVVVAGVAAAFAGVNDYLLGAAVIAGLVAATCSPALTALYVAVVIAWTISEIVRPGAVLLPSGSVVVAVLVLVSLLIGITIRQQYDRASNLAQQLEDTEREIAEQLRHERDLIADELHDIVAHEITIVALHAAVLERTADEQTRSTSQTAIREAAVQALTDIRRVLGMVRGEENLSPERLPSPDSLKGTIASVTKELAQAGIEVTVQIPDDVRLPSASLVAVIRVIRESATNVLKHATGARNVRIAFRIEHGWAHLEFTDDSPPARTAGLPASGYGIMRLRERFRLFGGSFASERGSAGWVVSASLPLES